MYVTVYLNLNLAEVGLGIDDAANELNYREWV
jgi:hypothetical protein